MKAGLKEGASTKERRTALLTSVGDVNLTEIIYHSYDGIFITDR